MTSASDDDCKFLRMSFSHLYNGDNSKSLSHRLRELNQEMQIVC